MRKISFAIIGLGSRGLDSYAQYALTHPEEMEIKAVADPKKEKRDKAAKLFNLDPSMVFYDADELLNREKLADAAIIATQDQEHVKQAVKALEKGYDILLEKPISPKKEEVELLEKKAKKEGHLVVVCHVLRYTPFYKTIKSLLENNAIGKLMSLDAIEHVGYWHQAHSFIRGNWRNESLSSPMLMQKSCHDMDIIRYLVGSPCKKIASYGGLSYFKAENAPRGASRRCMDGCKVKQRCPFDAEKIYITNKRTGIRHNPGDNWPCNILADSPDEEKLYDAICNGPYGRCVFYSDNDVVDHQVVLMEFASNVTATFTMTGFTADNHRTIKLFGTEGEIEGDMEKNRLVLRRFGEEEQVIPLEETCSGHGGGDEEIVKSFIMEMNGSHSASSTLEASIDSHMMVFAAEKSRKTGQVEILIKDDEIKSQAYDPEDGIVFEWAGRAEGISEEQ